MNGTLVHTLNVFLGSLVALYTILYDVCVCLFCWPLSAAKTLNRKSRQIKKDIQIVQSQ